MTNKLFSYSSLSKKAQEKVLQECKSLDYLDWLLVCAVNDGCKFHTERSGVYATPIIYDAAGINILSFSDVKIPEDKKRNFYRYCGYRPRDWKAMLSGEEKDFIIVEQSDLDTDDPVERYEVLLFTNSNPPFKYIESEELSNGLRKALSELYKFCSEAMEKIKNGDAETLEKCGNIFSEDGKPYSNLVGRL